MQQYSNTVPLPTRPPTVCHCWWSAIAGPMDCACSGDGDGFEMPPMASLICSLCVASCHKLMWRNLFRVVQRIHHDEQMWPKCSVYHQHVSSWGTGLGQPEAVQIHVKFQSHGFCSLSCCKGVDVEDSDGPSAAYTVTFC